MDPRDLAAMLSEAKKATETGRLTDAEKACRDALEMDPANDTALSQLREIDKCRQEQRSAADDGHNESSKFRGVSPDRGTFDANDILSFLGSDTPPANPGEALSYPSALRLASFLKNAKQTGEATQSREAPQSISPLYGDPERKPAGEKPFGLASTAHPAANPERAAQLWKEYREKQRVWLALPWWKRVRTPEPQAPEGI